MGGLPYYIWHVYIQFEVLTNMSCLVVLQTMQYILELVRFKKHIKQTATENENEKTVYKVI